MGMVAKSGVFNIGGELPVHRMGYGAMKLTGPGVWGPPEDEGYARALLRRAVELGVDFIDTADVYGPDHNERIIREALYPYPSGLVIGTKAGLVRKDGPATRENPGISMNGSERHIRDAVEGSLRKLGVECLNLCQLHRIDPAIPVEETMEVFRALRDEGKIRHIGLSEVGVEAIERARSVVEIATVQNVYNLITRVHEDVLTYCELNKIAFIPFWPLHSGGLLELEAVVGIAARRDARPAQVALAWLLQKSPSIILIPGTSSIAHLEQNIEACDLELSAAEMVALEGLADH
ncbi:aldo/keto reductase [Rhizobium sp. BK376]|uniref:aldo/keto reductase n=1 Tax=Rhizobium sp. BK376 TaxID=2512149 RepID=UPI0010E17AD9|nr:aldo/keto reductase [Rhizobium sp. BK376]TCR80756.1 aryl-alcohol dehydrogenase-like predicted oxidoreductase [Rhizobium sp. BK376]